MFVPCVLFLVANHFSTPSFTQVTTAFTGAAWLPGSIGSSDPHFNLSVLSLLLMAGWR